MLAFLLPLTSDSGGVTYTQKTPTKKEEEPTADVRAGERALERALKPSSRPMAKKQTPGGPSNREGHPNSAWCAAAGR